MYGQLSNRESLRDVVFAAQALLERTCRKAPLPMPTTSEISISLSSLRIIP
jgi:hypothetical protein